MVPIYNSSIRWNTDNASNNQILKNASAMYHLPLITYTRRITSYEIDVVDNWFVCHSNLTEVEHFRRFEVPDQYLVTIAIDMYTTVSCWHKLVYEPIWFDSTMLASKHVTSKHLRIQEVSWLLLVRSTLMRPHTVVCVRSRGRHALHKNKRRRTIIIRK